LGFHIRKGGDELNKKYLKKLKKSKMKNRQILRDTIDILEFD